MKEKYSKLYNIGLDELSNYFSTAAQKKISEMGVSNLGELIQLSEEKEFIDYFINSYKQQTSPSTPLYQQITGTIDLLKYKYLGFNLDADKCKSLWESGFSTQAIRGITCYFNKYNGQVINCNDCDLFALINMMYNDGSLKIRLLNIRKVGQKGLDEILLKMQILNDYFISKIKSDDAAKKGPNDETLQDLKKQYSELQKKREVLNKQILEISKRISEIESEKQNDEPERTI